MGEIKRFDHQSSPWIMELEVSNQPKRKVIAETFGDLRSNINISPKVASQTRTWQDVINQDKEAALADCKAKSFEYGDALISRDVACNELKERKNEEEKHQSEKDQQEKLQQDQNIIEKKENVSVSSELPVAKSKWGVKLRHVITRDASIDDKSEVDQPIYNFRKLAKRRPRSAVYEESPKTSEEVNQLWRSKSNELILDSQNEDSNNHEHASTLSVFQRMKSFEFNSKLHKPGLGKAVETFTKDIDTKPLSLVDLLNLDKHNLSIDVIDKSSSPVAERRKLTHSDSNDNGNNGPTRVDYDSREQSSESKNIVSNGVSEKDFYDVKKECLNNVLKKDADNYSTKVIDDCISKKPVNNISPKKLSVFGKMRSKQTKKAMSLEELLKLDEQNLSLDVVAKSKHRENDTDFKSEKTVSNANVIHAESGQDLNKTEQGNSDFQKGILVNDVSGTKEIGFRTMDTAICEKQIDFTLHPVKGNEVITNSTRGIDTKPTESKYPETTIRALSPQQRKIPKILPPITPVLNLKEKPLNEKLAVEATRNNPDVKYNKLGQIILSNDTMFEHKPFKAKNKAETANDDNVTINNSEVKSSGSDWKTDHNRIDSDIKYNKLGQIILSNDMLENGLTETKSQADILMSHENVNSNKIEVKGVGNSELINESEWKSDHTRQLSPKKCKEIHEINNNQKINGVNNVNIFDELTSYSIADPKTSVSTGGNHNVLLTQTQTKETVVIQKDKINHFEDSEIDIVDNSNETKQLDGISVDTGKKNMKEIDSAPSKFSLNNQICNNSHVTKKSDLNCNEISKNKPENQGYDQKYKNDVTNSSTKQEKQTKNTVETKISDQKSIHQQPELISSAPINRKVGKLIIMTGEQRNEQLKNKGKPQTPHSRSISKHIIGKMGGTSIEDLKKNHKEGFSLTFMSNELEDDGVPDDYPIPQIVFNEKVVGLKSMMHIQKNKAIKYVMFNPTKLATIHSYPAEENFVIEDDDVTKTKVDEVYSEPSFSNEPHHNVKSYEPSYSFDFGSVIQRERHRFNSMDEEADNLKSESKHEPTYDYNADGDHFNFHHNQDAGHALLF